MRAVSEARRCDECCFRNKCTTQICADLLAEGVPARLLLAFTSLRNFLVFVENRRRSGLSVEGAQIHLAVRNRGHWGEVLFLAEPAGRGQEFSNV